MGDNERKDLYPSIPTDYKMKKELAAVPGILRERIIQEGEISPDGEILRFKPLNRTVDVKLIGRVS